MSRHRVAVIGGHGTFGERIVRSLQRHPELELLVVGRRAASETRERVRYVRADVVDAAQLDALLALRPQVVVDTAGPFQARDPRVAIACAERGIHYIDLADEPRYVAGIARFDALAREHGALLVSGASTVPAVSTAIVDDLARSAAEVIAIDIGISPSQRAPRGDATVKAVLSTCGRPLRSTPEERRDYGFLGVGVYRYPEPVGRRLLSNVDTPERVLWPERYAALEMLRIRAGVELAPLHLGLASLAWLVRIGLIGDLASYACPLRRAASAFDRLGSDNGAMHVSVTCIESGERRCREGLLIAAGGDGPQIPSTPSALVVKKLLGLPGYAPLARRGACACMDLFSAAELMAELAGFAVHYVKRDGDRLAF